MIDFVISRSKVIRENHVLFLLIFRKSFTKFSKDVGLVLKMIDYNYYLSSHYAITRKIPKIKLLGLFTGLTTELYRRGMRYT